MIDRRCLLVGLLAAPRAWGQPAAKPARIGVLVYSPTLQLYEEFVGALRELGWVEGRNLIIERRFAGDSPQRARDMAAELQALPVALILASGTTMIRSARDGAPATPIVMINAGDALGAGFIASLRRPGGNLTGTTAAGEELLAKQLELLSRAAPQAKTVGVLLSRANPANDFFFNALSARARKLGLQLVRIEIAHDVELDAAVARAKGAPLLVLGTVLLTIMLTWRRTGPVGRVRSASILSRRVAMPASTTASPSAERCVCRPAIAASSRSCSSADTVCPW